MRAQQDYCHHIISMQVTRSASSDKVPQMRKLTKYMTWYIVTKSFHENIPHGEWKKVAPPPRVHSPRFYTYISHLSLAKTAILASINTISETNAENLIITATLVTL